MLPIVDKPTIQYIVEEALSSGIEDILIISGHGKRAIEDHFDAAPALEHELERKGKQELLDLVRETTDVNVHYVRQKYMRGLGDAILCAKSFVGNEPFAVLLGDDVVYHPQRSALRQPTDVSEETRGARVGRLGGDARGVSQPGATQAAVIPGKAERVDEVQHRAGIGAEADDVAGVGRDLRLVKGDMLHGESSRVAG